MPQAPPLLGSEMTEPSLGPLTRGFLFADLRDYTAFAETHGDRAAADLLDRYRSLVREVVAASAGAEIRTEGDSFYVVFPSASTAVAAGLAIVAHADLVEEVVRRLRAAGWETAVEVSFAIAGERGSVDILAFHPETAMLLVIEVKSVVPDLQGMLHGLDRKARLGRSIAAQRGWRVLGVARLLVVGETRTNRRRLAIAGATFGAALPASGRAVSRWLAEPSSPPLAGHWFVPFSRRVRGTAGGRQRVRLRRAEPNGAPEGPPGRSWSSADPTGASQRDSD